MKTCLTALFLTFCTLPLFSFANGDTQEKEAFLQAWESKQKQHPALEYFEKNSDATYNIKFKNIPFEGKLIVLNYDIESFQDFGEYLPVSKSGYIEYDLPELSDDITEKYYRSYSNWDQSNFLYFSSQSNTWIDEKEYADLIQDFDYDYDEGLMYYLSDYVGYILFVLFIYFVYSIFSNNGRTKKVIQIQELAFKQSMELSQESLKLQKYAIKKSEDNHEKTNILLENILNELKNK